MVHINNSRDAVNQLKRQLYEQKQGSQRKEKLDFEHTKSAQSIAKQNLEIEQLMTLRIGEKYNNLAQWLMQILKKHKEHYHPSGLKSFLYTNKQKAGNLKQMIRMCDTIPMVFDHLANQYLRGSEGHERVLNIRTVSRGSRWNGGPV